MEYASALIGIVAFGLDVVARVNHVLHTVKHAPAELQILRDRAAHLELILLQLRHARGLHLQLQGNLGQLAQRAEAQLVAVQRFVDRVRRSDTGAVARVRWLMGHGQFTELLERLDELNMSFAAIMTIVIAQSNVAIAGTLDELRNSHSEFVKHHALALADHTSALYDLKREVVDQLQTLHQGDQSAKHRLGAWHRVQSEALVLSEATTTSHRRAPGPLVCLDGCDCACHADTATLLTPMWLAPYFGNLYVSKRLLRAACTVQTCRRTHLSRARIEYVFPPWFVSVTATINTRSLPVSFCLSTPRLIPDTAAVCACIASGDVEGVKTLLLARQATIHDVTYQGYTLVHLAVMAWFLSTAERGVEVLRLLIEAGAPKDWAFHNGPALDMLFRFICIGVNDHPGKQFLLWARCSSAALEVVRPLFRTDIDAVLDDFIDRQTPANARYNRWVFGYTDDRSEDELATHLARRPMGTTPVAWAAQLAPDAVEGMLARGADARTDTPLVYALNWGNNQLVRPLIAAGADVNRPSFFAGYTPLHFVAKRGNYEGMRELVRCAGDRLDWDARTPDGKTALQVAEEGPVVLRLDDNVASEMFSLLKSRKLPEG